MTYYLKPPRGSLTLHILQKCVEQRLQFLQFLENGQFTTPKNFEYLFEGTAMDRTGHFMLRLLSLSSEGFASFVLHAETNLFIRRLEMFNSSHIVESLKTLYKHCKEFLQENLSGEFKQFLLHVKSICKNMISLDIAVHVFGASHAEDCELYNLLVPFTMCLPLVRKREVQLRGGNCMVPCGKWKYLLTHMFHLHIVLGIKQLQSSGCFHEAMSDMRLIQLQFRLEKRLRGNTDCDSALQRDIMRANEVDAKSIYFPPCILNLHSTLRSRHRLSHEARRQYTLFLKDADMPVEEAISFWSEEYSRPSEGCCSHSWQKDSRRLIYSIRHMYGLEGGRYKYRHHNCKTIQNELLTPCAEGGCPFKHFETEKLRKCFPYELQNEEDKLSQVLVLKDGDKPLKACQLYFSIHSSLLREKSLDSDSNEELNSKHRSEEECCKFASPLQYYRWLSRGDYKIK